jgi:hypothetical protein
VDVSDVDPRIDPHPRNVTVRPPPGRPRRRAP